MSTATVSIFGENVTVSSGISTDVLMLIIVIILALAIPALPLLIVVVIYLALNLLVFNLFGTLFPVIIGFVKYPLFSGLTLPVAFLKWLQYIISAKG